MLITLAVVAGTALWLAVVSFILYHGLDELEPPDHGRRM